MPKILQQLLRPIISDTIGYILTTTNAMILSRTLPKVKPNERTFTGKHSTVQISVSGTIPHDEINMINAMQMIGVQ